MIQSVNRLQQNPLITLPLVHLSGRHSHVDVPSGLGRRKGVGGGGTPIYKLYRFVRRQRVWFLSRFGLKMGIAFKDFGLKV